MTEDELYRLKIDLIEKRTEQILKILLAGPSVPKLSKNSIFNSADIESVLEVSRSTLYRWRKRRNIQLPRMGAQLIYHPEHITKLIERPKRSRRKRSSEDPQAG